MNGRWAVDQRFLPPTNCTYNSRRRRWITILFFRQTTIQVKLYGKNQANTKGEKSV